MSPATRFRPVSEAALRRRALINVLNLSTPLGLAVARLGGAAVRRGPDGLLLGEHYRLKLPVAGAFTIGNVVTTKHTFARLEFIEPRVLGHEGRHATQWSRLGLAFLPAYALASGWSWLRYGDPATGNFFEQGAGLVTGCYLVSGAMPQPRGVADALRSVGGALRRRPGRAGAWPSGAPGARPADDADV